MEIYTSTWIAPGGSSAALTRANLYFNGTKIQSSLIPEFTNSSTSPIQKYDLSSGNYIITFP